MNSHAHVLQIFLGEHEHGMSKQLYQKTHIKKEITMASAKKGKNILSTLFLILWPLILLRLGLFLQTTTLFAHTDTAPQFTDGLFLANYLFIGLVMLCVFLTFRLKCTGKSFWFLLIPLCYLFLLSAPAGAIDTLPVISVFYRWNIWYDEILHQALFFVYLISFIKNGIGTAKK